MNKAREQARQIGQLHDLLTPTPVEPGVPNWFRKRLLRAYGTGCCGIGGVSMLLSAKQRNGWRWIDHYGQTRWQGRLCFVVEPYDLDADDIVAIDQVARTIGCRWRLSANSWHFPGRTLRVLFFDLDEKQGGK